MRRQRHDIQKPLNSNCNDMTTKLEQSEAIITKVEQMRRWQKDYFAHRDALMLRKAKQIEKEIDEMITAYRGGNLDIIGDDPKQTALEL